MAPFVLLVGCITRPPSGRPPSTPASTSAPPPPALPAEVGTGVAPWSSVSYLGTDSLGAAVDGAPAERSEYPAVDRYRPRRELAEGLHGWTVSTPAGTVEGTFEVRPYGRDPAFDPAALAGRAYGLGEPGVDGELLAALAVPNLADLRLDFAAPVDGAARFRVTSVADGCVVFAAEADVTDGGEITWAQDELVAELGEPARFWDLSLHAGYLDGELGGVEVGGVVETGPLSVRALGGTPEALCEVLLTFGFACGPCPDGSDGCATVDTWDTRLVDLGEAPPADLRECRFVPTEGGGSDCSCATAGVAAPGAALLAALLARRRSRCPSAARVA